MSRPGLAPSSLLGALALSLCASCGATIAPPAETSPGPAAHGAPPPDAPAPAPVTPDGEPKESSTALPDAGSPEEPAVAVAPPPGGVVRAVAWDDRACAIFENGMLQCWGGFNHDGELGLGHTNRVKTPGWVKGISGVKKLALGQHATCAILGSGGLDCWGRNWFLEGDPRKQLTVPTAVPGFAGVIDVAIGERHACAVDSSGSVACWGENGEGQLGLGVAALGDGIRKPTRVPGVQGAVGVAASHGVTLVWTGTGELLRWGQAADASRPWAAPVPRRVEGLSGVRRAWVTGEHACALLASSEVRCFTHETLAALAAGKQHDMGPALAALARAIARRPVSIPRGAMVFPDGRGLTGATDVLVFNHDATALTAQGEVFSWGSAKRGTVGRPEKTKGLFPPTRIKGLTDTIEIAGSFMHRCALDRSGKVRCFGSGMGGRLGVEAHAGSVSAVEIAGLPRIAHIASGDHCSFAVGEDHSLWYWGESWVGACGSDDDGQTVTKTPQQVPLDRSAP
jgi:alpha-tubulin suppressor-like RCC1 family protein